MVIIPSWALGEPSASSREEIRVMPFQSGLPSRLSTQSRAIPPGHISSMMCMMKIFANISLAFYLDAQICVPPAEPWSGSATDADETILRVVDCVDVSDWSSVSGSEAIDVLSIEIWDTGAEVVEAMTCGWSKPFCNQRFVILKGDTCQTGKGYRTCKPCDLVRFCEKLTRCMSGCLSMIWQRHEKI